MTRPTPRLPSPYRPDPAPHRIRTVALLAWAIALLVFIVWAGQATVR